MVSNLQKRHRVSLIIFQLIMFVNLAGTAGRHGCHKKECCDQKNLYYFIAVVNSFVVADNKQSFMKGEAVLFANRFIMGCDMRRA